MRQLMISIAVILVILGGVLTITPASAHHVEEPQPVRFQGLGDVTTPKAVLLQGLSVIFLHHYGSGDFRVTLINDSREEVAELTDWYGRCHISRALRIEGNGLYRLKIEATGRWTTTINQPRPDWAFPVTYLTGSTTEASQLFWLNPGSHLFQVEYEGRDWFRVNLLDDEGYHVARLGETEGGNRRGYYNELIIDAPYGGIFILDVEADDRWKIWVD